MKHYNDLNYNIKNLYEWVKLLTKLISKFTLWA
jgi:hypothetical protein